MATIRKSQIPRTLLALPCNVRQHLYQHTLRPQLATGRQGSRPLSTDTLGSTLYTLPASAMSAIHSAGLPWWAAIPVSAILFRSLITLPFSQVIGRRSQIKMQLLQPLIDARLSLFKRELMRRTPHMQPNIQRFKMRWESMQLKWRLGGAFKARAHYLTPWLGVLFLLYMGDNVRKLCGRDQSVLDMLFAPIVWAWQSLSRTPKESSQEQETIHNPEAPGAKPQSQPIDPTLQTEGVPFFCPDLTKPDSSWALPVILVLSYWINISIRPAIDQILPSDNPMDPTNSANASKTPDNIQQIWQSNNDKERLAALQKTPEPTFWQKAAMLYGLVLGYAAVQMPAGVVLYFIYNIWTGFVHSRVLAKKMPMRLAPTACKRPVRYNPQTERMYKDQKQRDMFLN